MTKRFHFSASHRLFRSDFTDEENERVFGKCSNPNGHGHNYILEVTVSGEPDKGRGFVINLSELKKIVNENIISLVDHKNLNIDVDFMRNVIPSAENIVIKFWDRLENKIKDNNAKLYSLKLFETENNIAEYKGK